MRIKISIYKKDNNIISYGRLYIERIGYKVFDKNDIINQDKYVQIYLNQGNEYSYDYEEIPYKTFDFGDELLMNNYNGYRDFINELLNYTPKKIYTHA